MPDVKKVFITVRNPSDGDPGQVSTGYYTIANGVMTMTDGAGTPMRHQTTGELFTWKLRPGDKEISIANMMTRKVRRTFTICRMTGRPGLTGRSSIAAVE